MTYLTLVQQTVLNLLGHANDPTRLVGDRYDEERMIPLHQHTKNRGPLAYTYVLKLILGYLFHDYAQARHQAEIAEPYLDNMIASYFKCIKKAPRHSTGVERMDAYIRFPAVNGRLYITTMSLLMH